MDKQVWHSKDGHDGISHTLIGPLNSLSPKRMAPRLLRILYVSKRKLGMSIAVIVLHESDTYSRTCIPSGGVQKPNLSS